MKNKAFILDFNLLSEQNLSVDEFVTLLYLSENSLRKTSINHLNSLQDKQFIKLNINDNEEITIREKGKLLIEFLEIESINSVKDKKLVKKSSRAINAELNDFIQEFRALWKGLKPGSMGSEISCRDKMYKWMQMNPSYTKEDILKAAKLYIRSLNDLRFIQQADYFIFKKDAHGESSRLSAFIDEVNDVQVDDWTTTLN
jgi:hypothetical protein